MFLGYSSQQKGYKVLNLATKAVVVSRDVVFDTSLTITLIHNPVPPLPSNSSSLVPFLTLVL